MQLELSCYIEIMHENVPSFHRGTYVLSTSHVLNHIFRLPPPPPPPSPHAMHAMAFPVDANTFV